MRILLLWFCTAFVLLPTQNDGREYHYDRPHVPFPAGGAPSQSGQHFVVGARGTQFDVHMVRSNSVYEGYVQGSAAGASYRNNYAPRQPYAQQATTPHVNPLYPPPPPPQSQHQRGYAQPFHAQQANYQQQQQYAGVASNAYGRSIDVPFAYAGGGNGAGGAGGYGGGYNGGVSQGYGAQNGAQHGSQYGPQNGPQNGGAQFVGAHSQPVGFGGHAGAGFGHRGGSGGGGGGAPGAHSVNAAAEALSTAHGGKHVSQSEAAQLDQYPYKQYNIGDPRAYQRHVKVCYGNGQCVQSTLAPGQVDPQQFPITTAARAQVAPVSDKCKRIAEANLAAAQSNAIGYPGYPYSQSQSHIGPQAPNGAVPNSYYQAQSAAGSSQRQATAPGPARPRDRRLFAYSEVPIKQDPFN